MMRVASQVLLGLAAALVAPASSQGADDPLLRPIAPQSAARWLQPQAPARIFGNTWLVGFGGLNIALIRTRDGLILIDAGPPQAVPTVEANIRSLGFDPRDVRLILSTEPHFDHSGGLAALARDTGATVVASAAAAEVLRRGRSARDDPQAAWLPPFPPVERLRVVRDGERISLGGTTVTARAWPGHTPGSMGWTWRSCEERRCAAIVFGASLNPVADENYRFSDPARSGDLSAFRRTFAAARALQCDILLTSHPDQSDGESRSVRLRQRREPNPYLDPGACRALADRHEQLLDRRLAEEAAAQSR